MASLQGSVATVNSRKCTRSRPRTAASSTLITERSSVVTFTEGASSIADVQSNPQAIAEVPFSLSPSSTTPAKQTSVTRTTDAMVSSPTGTDSALPTPSAPDIALPDVVPSNRVVVDTVADDGESSIVLANAISSDTAVAILDSSPESNSLVSGSSQAVAASVSLRDPTPTRSDPISSAIFQSRPASSIGEPLFTATPDSNVPPSGGMAPEIPPQTILGPPLSTMNQPVGKQTGQVTSVTALFSTRDSAGTILPDDRSNNLPLTLPTSGNVNVRAVLGGIVGGIACLALISGLLFYCLKRKSPQAVVCNENDIARPPFHEKLKASPTRFEFLIEKIKGKKKGLLGNPDQESTLQHNATSASESNTIIRTQSSSGQQGMFTGRRTGSNWSISSKKSERNLLRKKQGSISSNYQFPGITEDRQIQCHADYLNPFTDPAPSTTLLLLNPDPLSTPVTPQVFVATANVIPKDSFASVHDLIDNIPPRTSNPNARHTHNQSSISAVSTLQALNSHQPSPSYNANQFFNGFPVSPLAPTQAVLSGHSRRPSSAAYPLFNPASTPASRDSEWIMFGEPGPSRPVTNMLNSSLSMGRTIRQSDPFDLDRPEVLGFRDVYSRRENTSANTRQSTNGKR